jgi:CRP-like cAMP-binding protein/predicted MFS family arabinose efflux permease
LAKGPSYRNALRNRDFRLLSIGFAQSSMGDWAYNVALVVYIFDQTHSAAWLSAATLARMVPCFFASPYAGVIAERFERIRLMITADSIRFVLMSILALAMVADSPAWVVIAISAVSAITATVYEPSTAAMTPQLLGEEELAAGNAVIEVIHNLAIIAGPMIGALVLLAGDPAVVVGIDAVTFLISVALLSRVKARSTPTDVTRDGGPFKQMTVGVKAIVGSSTASLLTAFVIVTTLLYGVDTVLFVFLSDEKLGTGPEGFGYLLIALGVGGVLAATFVNRLAALPRLSLILAAGMIGYAAPTLLLVWVTNPGVAFGVEVVRGVATLIVDVLAMTALQRSLAPELISRVFGVFWALVIAGLSIGAFVAPFSLNAFGLDTTLWLDALIVPAAVVLVYPKLASLDRLASVSAEALAPRVSVLSGLDIFAAAPRPSVERIAKGITEIVLEPGTAVVREGETADALYVIVDGRVDVSAQGEYGTQPTHIRYMTGPSYVGEIGLLEGIPRTATVTAVEPTKVWRIDGELFQEALTSTPLSASFVSGMSMRLKQTHPSREVHIPGPRDPAEADASPPVAREEVSP